MLKHLLLIFSLLFVLPLSASAQNSCLRSFNIPVEKRDAPIKNYLWLPGYKDTIGSLTCSSADALRSNLYEHNRDALERAVASDRLNYIAALEVSVKSLEKRISELRNKI